MSRSYLENLVSPIGALVLTIVDLEVRHIRYAQARTIGDAERCLLLVLRSAESMALRYCPPLPRSTLSGPRQHLWPRFEIVI